MSFEFSSIVQFLVQLCFSHLLTFYKASLVLQGHFQVAEPPLELRDIHNVYQVTFKTRKG